jgi:hypothetical protein
MLRKVIGALFALVLCFGIALADEFGAAITKVSDGKITFAKTKFNQDTMKLEKGPETTLPVAANVKVLKGKFSKEAKGKLEAGDPIEGGLKNEMFSTIGEKGLFSSIVTDSENKTITEIRVSTFKKKKDN